MSCVPGYTIYRRETGDAVLGTFDWSGLLGFLRGFRDAGYDLRSFYVVRSR